EASIRARSFLWPVIGVAVGLGVCAFLALSARRRGRHLAPSNGAGGGEGRRARWWAGAVLLGAETAFLVSAGAPLASSSPSFATPTAREVALQRAVGTSLVAFGSRDCHLPPTLGMHQDINDVYGVRELADYDPMLPADTFRSLAAATGARASARGAPLILCPAVDSADVARRYGVGYILEQPGAPAPTGTQRVATIGGEGLYRVPGAGLVTLASAASHDAVQTPDDTGTPVTTTSAQPNTLEARVQASASSVLQFHVTAVPGWHATMDGRPLRLVPLAGTMLQARVPAGHHTVELRYWPSAFTAGLVLGLLAVLGLAVGVAVEALHRRR
ncbi:MAG TPA: YfhO family protein, partial [Acidimicrobiales bacterium]|nr:YfhO family protein [Acidimicrobiales bacterium]